MHDTNPYASPQTAAEPKPQQGFRWRFVPSAFLVLFGGVLVLGSLAVSVLEVISPRLAGTSVRVELFFGALLMMLAGVVWVASGIAIWKRWWRRGIFGAVAGYVLGVLAMHFISSGGLK